MWEDFHIHLFSLISFEVLVLPLCRTYFGLLQHDEFFLYSMSAIDFYCSVDKVKGVDGKDRVVVTFDGKYLPHSEQVKRYLSQRYV